MTHNVAEFLLIQQSLNRQWVSGGVPGGSAVKNFKTKKQKQNKTWYMIDSVWFSRRVISGKKKKKSFYQRLLVKLKRVGVRSDTATERRRVEKNNKIAKRSQQRRWASSFSLMLSWAFLLGNGRPARLGPSQSCQGITVLPCSPQGVRSGPQLPWSGVFDLAGHFWGRTKSWIMHH